MRTRWWLSVLFVGLLVFSMLFVGCGKDDDEEVPEQPELPPTGIFNSVDFSLFLNPDSIFNPAIKSLDRCAHFDTACFIVGVSCVVIEAAFFWPKIAFALAMTQEPTYEGDLTWRWTLGHEDNNISLYAILTSSHDSVDWEMRVTNAEVSNFLWYSGRCNFAATGGWWEFNDKDTLNEEFPVLWVGWERNPTDTTGSLTIANINESDTEGYGDTISYWRDGLISNAILNIHGGDRPGIWTIIWHSTEHWGTIFYPEGEQFCWDDSAQCIECDSLDLPPM
ncbi:hypothetical protein DRQ33_07130 [bacterium]|nr:MAG: hypothetical protein DRQ33_07130 [bacterium]